MERLFQRTPFSRPYLPTPSLNIEICCTDLRQPVGGQEESGPVVCCNAFRVLTGKGERYEGLLVLDFGVQGRGVSDASATEEEEKGVIERNTYSRTLESHRSCYGQ